MTKLLLPFSLLLFLSGCAAAAGLVGSAILAVGSSAIVEAETDYPGPQLGFAKLCDLGGGFLEPNGDCTAPWSDNYPD